MNGPDRHGIETFLINLARVISLILLLAFVLWTEYHHLFGVQR